MPSNTRTSFDRRRVLTALGASSVVALAGCIGGDDETDDETDGGEADGENGDDENGGDETDQLSSLDPGPDGESLSEADIRALVAAFDDQPMNDAQLEVEGENRSYTPRHVWNWVSDETLIGLHFDDPNPEAATALDYITIGRKGLFTEESRPGEEFSHFHQHTADGWEAGHGGAEGDEGYWLTHIATREIEYPFHDAPIEPQVDYGFMPTPPEEGSEGHDADWETPDGGEGDLSADERDELIDIFDDEWTNDAQQEANGYTPSHVWKWVTEDVFLFLHFDEPNPEEAENLLYFGIGQRGQFTADDIPAGQEDDFTHFHQWEADSWDAGHGAQEPDQHGAWLVHHTVREVEMPFHSEPIGVGVDREFMPTPAGD